MSERTAIVLTGAFPRALEHDVRVAESRFTHAHPPAGAFGVHLSTETVAVPYRLYLDESVNKPMTATQQLIVHCLYTRHHDGHLRESHLSELLDRREEWVCPFVWAPLGEYVLELITLIEANVQRIDRPLYADFLARNPEFKERTRQRAISYWDCYYRKKQFKTFEQYPASRVFELFDGPPRGASIPSA